MSHYYDNASDEDPVDMSEDEDVCDSASHYSSVTSWGSLRSNARPKESTFGMGGAAAALREGSSAWSAMGALQALSQAHATGDASKSRQFVAAAQHVAEGERHGALAQPAAAQQSVGLSDDTLFGTKAANSASEPPLMPPASMTVGVGVGGGGDGSAFVRSGDAKLVLDGGLAARWAADAADGAEASDGACDAPVDSAKSSLSPSPVNC